MRRSYMAAALGIVITTTILGWLQLGWTAKPAPQATQKLTPKKTGETGKPFVIRETYRESALEPSKTTDDKGIVGLDMLVEPDRYPVVQRVFRGTPAQIQGIRVGDTILAINGVRTLHQSLWQLDALISNVPGDLVTLTILRDGKLRKFGLTVMPLSEANASVRNNFSGLGP